MCLKRYKSVYFQRPRISRCSWQSKMYANAKPGAFSHHIETQHLRETEALFSTYFILFCFFIVLTKKLFPSFINPQQEWENVWWSQATNWLMLSIKILFYFLFSCEHRHVFLNYIPLSYGARIIQKEYNECESGSPSEM